jgi:hypothetical protein
MPNMIASKFWLTALVGLTSVLAPAQGLQNSGLAYMQTIPVPNWPEGTANTDVFGFNPVTRIMYLADRTNHGVDVIDTHNNFFLGTIPTTVLPAGPNVPLVAIDQQQLAITDGGSLVLVYDLRQPGSKPDQYTMPSTTTDGMDYDPINRTIYVITDDAPYYLVGISLPYKQITTKTLLPASPDLIKWNPTDGKIYISVEDADNNNAGAGVVVYDPAANAVTAWYKVGPACPGHGIDIDPISNVAIVGCFGGTSNGDMAISLKNGAVQKYFSDVGGTDTIVFNPNNRRFYAGAGLNSASTSGCPGTLPSAFGATVPIVGVFDAISGTAALDGVACTGRGNHVAGVDPINNVVYVPVAQYPADPASNTTGQAGILLFRDTTPVAQALLPQTQVVLSPVGGSVTGTIVMTLTGTRVRVSGNPAGISGQAAWFVVPTTVGNEIIDCAVNTAAGSAVCGEYLIGQPLVGATATLSVDSVAVARGTIAAPAGK